MLSGIEISRMEIFMFCGKHLREQQHAKFTKTMTKKSTLVKEKSGRFEASWYDNTRTLHINMGTTFVSRFLFPSLCVVYVEGSNMLNIVYNILYTILKLIWKFTIVVLTKNGSKCLFISACKRVKANVPKWHYINRILWTLKLATRITKYLVRHLGRRVGCHFCQCSDK